MTDEQWTLEELTLSAEERWRFEARATVATIINDAYAERTGQQIADDRWLDEVTAKIAEVMWAAESSRRDWAAEAIRLDMVHQLRRRQLAKALNAPRDKPWSGLLSEANRLAEAWLDGIAAELAAERQVDAVPVTVCACISDDQATHLGPRFSRPVCAVHPTGESADA